MNITFPEGAEDYYEVDAAKKLIEERLYDPTCKIWRCVLCGYPIFIKAECDDSIVGATGCGGCGQTCMRPIAEYGDDLS